MVRLDIQRLSSKPASNSQCWMWIVSNLNWNNKIQIMIGPAASRGRVEKLSVTAASRDSDVFLEMHFHFPHPMCSIHNLGHLHLAFHVIFYCCHLYHSFMFWACSWKLKYDINQSSYKFYRDENEKVWFREFLQCLITVVINVDRNVSKLRLLFRMEKYSYFHFLFNVSIFMLAE